MAINRSRVVEIYRGTQNWRAFGSRLLTDATVASAEAKFLDKEFVVKDSVYLLMDTGTPKYSTSNEYSSGLDDLAQTVGRAVNDLAEGTKLGSALKGLGASVTGLATTALDVGANVINGEGAAFNPWWLDAPTWNGTRNTMSFDYSFNFAMGQYGLWNAKEEVVKPALSLIMPSMIKKISNNEMIGPGPRTFDLIKGAFGWDALENLLKEGIGSNVVNECSNFLYTFQFGDFLSLSNVLVKNTDVSFSSEVDTNRMPIAATVTLHCATFVPQSISTNNESLISMRFHNIGNKNGQNLFKI